MAISSACDSSIKEMNECRCFRLKKEIIKYAKRNKFSHDTICHTNCSSSLHITHYSSKVCTVVEEVFRAFITVKVPIQQLKKLQDK